jgi:hypothetical protein
MGNPPYKALWFSMKKSEATANPQKAQAIFVENKIECIQTKSFFQCTTRWHFCQFPVPSFLSTPTVFICCLLRVIPVSLLLHVYYGKINRIQLIDKPTCLVLFSVFYIG